MPKRYFGKELPGSPLWIFGSPFRFDFLETEDTNLIHELDNAIRNRMGGVYSITEAQYAEEQKKKQDANPSGSSSNQRPWRQELVAPFSPAQNAAGRGSFAKPQQPPAVAPQLLNPQPHEAPDPLTVPSPESLKIPKPPTAKLNKPTP